MGGIFRIPNFGLEEICYFLLFGFGVQQQPGPYLGTEGEKTHMGKFKKRWFGPFRVQYCLPNNIV
jgi:hypothetical protein